MGRVIPLRPYRHQCVPGTWRNYGICPLCEEHRAKLTKYLRASRLRARMRKGIVK